MMKKKPNMSIGGKISCCDININRNKSFDEEEGNLIKIKMVDIGVSLDMFDTSENKDNINGQNNTSTKEKLAKERIYKYK